MDSDPSTPVTETDAAPSPSVPRAVPRRDILSVKFACGACGQHIEAPRDLFGEVMPCPACGALHQIPDVKNAPRSFPVKRIVPIRPRP
jgi:hypothetical protein